MSTNTAESNEGRFERLTRGTFGRIILPAIVLQSVLIGGGYATGREVIAYGAKYGAAGWLAILVIWFGFTVMAVLTFELAERLRHMNIKGLANKSLAASGLCSICYS